MYEEVYNLFIFYLLLLFEIIKLFGNIFISNKFIFYSRLIRGRQFKVKIK